MIDFKDRIPTQPNRKLIVPVDSVADTYIVTYADEPTENGTPINRALFTDIQTEITKNGVALQSNSSTTAYTSDFPLLAYNNGMKFVFIPSVTNTGAITINFNSLGAKKVYNESGTIQLSTINSFVINKMCLLIYDSLLDSSNGGFKNIQITTDNSFIVGNTPILETSGYSGIELPSRFASISGTTYYVLFERTVLTNGVIRVKVKIAGNGNTAYGKITKNGILIGAEHSTTTVLEFSEDVLISKNDKIEVSMKSGNTSTVYLLGCSFQVDNQILGFKEIIPLN